MGKCRYLNEHHPEDRSMSIWHGTPTVEDANRRGQNTAVSHLGIEITEIGDDFLVGTMPVDDRSRQTFGLLHGGCSAMLAETLGSLAGNFCVDQRKTCCVGMEINANHLRPVKQGQVRGVARAIHLGRSTQVWEINIYNADDQPVCVSRLTLAVVPRE